MLFVCYPKCSTCGKARAWLEANGFGFTERDIKLDNPTAEELRAWHEKSGLPWKRFFNTSGQLYRSMGLSGKVDSMDEDEIVSLLASDGMLVKRPILVTDSAVPARVFVLFPRRDIGLQGRVGFSPLPRGREDLRHNLHARRALQGTRRA